MTALADFLAAKRDTIVASYRERVFAAFVPGAPLADGELVDLVPAYLDELVGDLRGGVAPNEHGLAPGDTLERRGWRRLRAGFDLTVVVRDYGLLRDCIYEALETSGVAVSLRELRALSARLSVAATDAAKQFVLERQEGVDVANDRYRALFEAIDEGVCLIEVLFDGQGKAVDYRFLETNAMFEAHTGLRDAVGKTMREMVPNHDEHWFEFYGRVVTTGEPGRIENQASDMGRWFDAYAIRVGVPERHHVMIIFKDITVRKHVDAERAALLVRAQVARAEAETERKNQHDLFMQAPVPIGIIEGPAHTYTFANPAYRALINGRDVVGKALHDALPDVKGMGFDRLLDQVMTTGEAFVAREMPIKLEHHVGDDLLIANFVFTPKRNAAGCIDGVLMSGWDVTTLVRARQQAEAANRLKDEFLTIVSHELRTPLSAMLGWVQLLRSGKVSPEKRDKALETIERNARAQNQLIDDLLDMSRILAGRLRLEAEPLELSSIVEAALETVRPTAEARGIRLQAMISSPATVMGDPRRLQQIVWNLLSNAVKFTPKGGRVSAAVAVVDSSVELVVADTGQGIAPSFLPHIFERFRQADGSTTRRHGGLGLGLSIVRQLVEMHGGVVSASSEGEGRGATLTVRLPIVAATRHSASSPPERPVVAEPPCPPELEGLNIVVVDDDDDTREMLREVLEGCRARVRLAASAAEALRLLEADRPQILLSDIGMPDEDGYSLIQKVRTLQTLDDVPALAITAYVGPEDRARALQAGFQNHLPKPVEPANLLVAVASLAKRPPTR